jgi:DNA-binding MarR family transcriptional regulator
VPIDDGALVASWWRARAGLDAVSAVLAGEVEAATGLGMTAFLVLGRLAADPARTVPMSRLAGQLRFTTGGFTKLCDRLVQLGLVERRGAAHDRRVVLAVLTARGERVAGAGLAAYAAALRRIVVPVIGEEGMDELVALADRLADATRELAAEACGATAALSPPTGGGAYADTWEETSSG